MECLFKDSLSIAVYRRNRFHREWKNQLNFMNLSPIMVLIIVFMTVSGFAIPINKTLDSRGFFVGKIIKMWEHKDQRKNPRRVELLWFFKPSEIMLHLKGVQDVLVNELLLASRIGRGLTNENQLVTKNIISFIILYFYNAYSLLNRVCGVFSRSWHFIS